MNLFRRSLWVFVLLAAACVQRSDAQEVVVDVEAARVEVAPIRLSVGQVMRVRLPASPASGYDWVLAEGLPGGLGVESDPGLAPTPAVAQTWRFRARERGRGQVRFVRRPRIGTEPTASRFETLDIVVD